MPLKLLQDLNAEQSAAVKATEGYVRVTAGAGTGKTRTLTYRYAYLLSALGISPRSVLCVTFTNKAALELKERVFKLCGDIANPFVTTFHGFCAEFLRTEIKAVGFPQNFTILDVADCKTLIKQIFRALKVNGREFSLKQAWEMIDGRESEIDYAYDYISQDSSKLLTLAEEAGSLQDKIFYNFLYLKRQQYGVDFDDLIALTLLILQEYPQVRERWQERLEYILVDEFQDIDKLQNQLVEILASRHGNLFIVGDPDQTIYTFRGASVKFFTGFKLRHPEAKLYSLTHNYRSQPFILDCAYTVISHNEDNGRRRLVSHLKMLTSQAVPLELKALQPKDALYADLRRIGRNLSSLPPPLPKFELAKQPPQSLKPALIHLKSRRLEAQFITDEVKLIREQFPQASIAVLYRSRFVSAPIEKAFIQAGLPYTVYSDVPFFSRAEVKDALAYLKLVLNPHDDLSFRRVINSPRRGFGVKRLQRLTKLAAEDNLSLFAALCRHAADDELRLTSEVREFITVLEQLCAAPRLGPLAEYERVLNAFGYERYLKDIGDEERLASLNMLREQCGEFERGAGERTYAADFLHHIALYTDAEQRRQPDAVQLMTVHNAKGLEFDYVFISALNEGIFPSAKSQNLPEIEEERRLLYVALTRAKRQLFLTESADYSVQDSAQLRSSRFLSELRADEILECGGRREPLRAGGGVELKVQHFAPGQEVFNEVIGRGRVEAADAARGEYKIFFYELNKVRTMSFSAPLLALDDAASAEDALEQGKDQSEVSAARAAAEDGSCAKLPPVKEGAAADSTEPAPAAEDAKAVSAQPPSAPPSAVRARAEDLTAAEEEDEEAPERPQPHFKLALTAYAAALAAGSAAAGKRGAEEKSAAEPNEHSGASAAEANAHKGQSAAQSAAHFKVKPAAPAAVKGAAAGDSEQAAPEGQQGAAVAPSRKPRAAHGAAGSRDQAGTAEGRRPEDQRRDTAAKRQAPPPPKPHGSAVKPPLSSPFADEDIPLPDDVPLPHYLHPEDWDL